MSGWHEQLEEHDKEGLTCNTYQKIAIQTASLAKEQKRRLALLCS